MTTPKDKWISVKDAMPEIDSPESEGYDLICMDDVNQIFHVEYYAPTKEFLTIDDYSVTEVTHWMLLSKPKTTN